MDIKSKFNREFMLVNGDLLDVTAWALLIAEDVTESTMQSIIDKYESTIGDAWFNELKDYEEHYLFKDGQIEISENIFLVSGVTLREGAKHWDYEVSEFVADDDIFIEDYATYDCKESITYKITCAADIEKFFNGNVSELKIEHRALTKML